MPCYSRSHLEDLKKLVAKQRELLCTLLPRILPLTWKKTQDSEDGAAYQSMGGIRVIVTIDYELDSKWWLHVSLSRAERLPSWGDIKDVKELFIGRDKTAVQVFPPASKYVNQHPYCLHLWHCIDGDVTPDFTQGGNSI